MESRRALRVPLFGMLALLLVLGATPVVAQEAEDPGPVEITFVKAWFGADGMLVEDPLSVSWGIDVMSGPEGLDIVTTLPGDNVATFEWVEHDGDWYPSRYGVAENPAPFGWEAVACETVDVDEEQLELPGPFVQSDTSEIKVAQGAPDGSIAATDSGVHLVCNQRLDPADVESIWPDLLETSTHYLDVVDLAIDGIFEGRVDGTFGPAAEVTRGQVATVLVKAAGITGAVQDTPTYDDIAGTTHEANIEALVELEVITGYPDRTFRPNQAVSRAQVASMLGRWLEVEEVADGPFVDVEAESTHAGYINALAEADVIAGTTDTTFDPDNDLRRDQFAALVNRAR